MSIVISRSTPHMPLLVLLVKDLTDDRINRYLLPMRDNGRHFYDEHAENFLLQHRTASRRERQQPESLKGRGVLGMPAIIMLGASCIYVHGPQVMVHVCLLPASRASHMATETSLSQNSLWAKRYACVS